MVMRTERQTDRQTHKQTCFILRVSLRAERQGSSHSYTATRSPLSPLSPTNTEYPPAMLSPDDQGQPICTECLSVCLSVSYQDIVLAEQTPGSLPLPLAPPLLSSSLECLVSVEYSCQWEGDSLKLHRCSPVIKTIITNVSLLIVSYPNI